SPIQTRTPHCERPHRCCRIASRANRFRRRNPVGKPFRYCLVWPGLPVTAAVLLFFGGGVSFARAANASDWPLAIKGHRDDVKCVAISPDGKWLASGSQDKTVKIWELATGKEVHTLRGHRGAVQSVAFSPDGKRLASGSLDETLKVWDVATGEVLS